MNKKRPVNLDIATIKLPITAYVSILHRASGVFLFAGVAVLLWMLDASLDSQEGFNSIGDLAANPVCQFVLWAVLAGLAYHMVLGIRHLIMDFGIGETMEGGTRGARIVFIVTAILAVLVGAAIW